MFSDAAVHTRCLSEFPDRAELEELLARLRHLHPSMNELGELELELHAETTAHRELGRTEHRWRELHQAYADRPGADEGLKRALFIQWYARAEPSFVTGIGELDAAAERTVLRTVSRCLSQPDEHMNNAELRAMAAWYQQQHRPEDWELDIAEPFGSLDRPPCEAIDTTLERGVMGLYWAQCCGEWGATDVRGSQASKAAAFERALRVLDGLEPAPRGDGRAHKGLALVLPLTEASRVDVTPNEAVARHTGDARRTMMFVESLPAVLGDLMRRAGLDRVVDSVVCRLPAGLFFSGHKPDLTMWIVRESMTLTLYFSAGGEVTPPAEPLSPIDGARFPVPEILPPVPWAPEPHVHVEQEGRCPHCKVQAGSWRKISSGDFVCGVCGRSFSSDDLEP